MKASNPMKPLMINVKKLEYQNNDATENLIRYITRTRANEDRAHELLSYGFNSGFTYLKPIEDVIREFEYVHTTYQSDGCLMSHYVIHISNELYACMGENLNAVNTYATECCNFLFQMGHQACFAVHFSKKDRLHIHLAINRVNFTNGNKLRQYPTEIKKTIEIPLCSLIQKYLIPVTHNLSLDEM